MKNDKLINTELNSSAKTLEKNGGQKNEMSDDQIFKPKMEEHRTVQ